MLVEGILVCVVTSFAILCHAMYSSSLVESLKCYCADHVIAEIPFPLTPCSSGNSCDTTGKCLVNLRLVENSGYLVETYTYRCVSDGDVEGIPSVGVLCGLDAPSPTQAILCCNNTDFCNRDLNPRTLLTSLPAMSPSPTPVMVLSPTSTPSAGHGNTGTVRDHIVAMYYVLYVHALHKCEIIPKTEVMVVYEEQRK